MTQEEVTAAVGDPKTATGGGWDYPDDAFSISFSDGRVNAIFCGIGSPSTNSESVPEYPYRFKALTQGGVGIGSGRDEVLADLGTPSGDRTDEVGAEYLRYRESGLAVSLWRGRVYNISVVARRASAPDYSCLTNSQWLTGDAHTAWLRGRGAVGCLTEAERSTPEAVSKIAITRWGGESYSLTLGKDGSVTYDGYCGMTRLGCHVGWLATWRFDRLARLATEIGFIDLDARYESDATDQQVVFVAVRAFECERAVLDYGMVGPSRLWALEEMISAALNDVEWRE